MSNTLNLLKLHSERDAQSLQCSVDSALFLFKMPRRDDGRWDLIAQQAREKAEGLRELADFLDAADARYREIAGDE